jgi:hypothetical protein
MGLGRESIGIDDWLYFKEAAMREKESPPAGTKLILHLSTPESKFLPFS